MSVPRGTPMHGGDLSLLSWNLLAENCTIGGVNKAIRYAHVPPEDLAWETRCSRILREVLVSDADVLCFQEVDIKNEASLRVPLEEAGYAGLLQKKDDAKHPTVNATFWKTCRLNVVSEVHRSRVFTTIFVDEQGRLLAVANCHLEGHPRESVARVKQLQSTLKQLQQLRHHGVIIVGDFNCELQTSACASYLAFGTVLPGVIEWGVDVPCSASQIPGHGYELSSAYPSTGDHFSFTIRGTWRGLLDQIWHSHRSLQVVGLRNLLENPEHRCMILAQGLPSALNPSDHLPVGAVFKWEGVLPELNAKPTSMQPSTASMNPLEEAALLLANCPWTEAQRVEWEAATTLPELPKNQKPPPEQLELLQSLRKRKECLLAELTDEARQILQRVVELQKQARKAAAKTKEG